MEELIKNLQEAISKEYHNSIKTWCSIITQQIIGKYKLISLEEFNQLNGYTPLEIREMLEILKRDTPDYDVLYNIDHIFRGAFLESININEKV